MALSVPAKLAAMDNMDGRAETGLSTSCISYEAEELCGLSKDERSVDAGSSSTDASNGSRGNLMGDVLRLFSEGDIERSGCKNDEEDLLSNDGRGLCNRLEARLAGVVVPEPEGSLDLVLRWPRCENFPEAFEPIVDGPSSVIATPNRLLLDSRLSRDVRPGDI